MRDYGLTTGMTNDRVWARREVHLLQDNCQVRLTLWNQQVQILATVLTFIFLYVKSFYPEIC
jgi:hypothetical protein